ncbi:MAG TPA: AMMECR1 domain-containing protein [Spirochaetaceae bacterium]|nr:AMMECR1 domain-containing protein [Spirochaetaceae bacterium]
MNFSLDNEDKEALLASAREAITARLEGRTPRWPRCGSACDAQCGAFVTLHIGKRLRGCIGRMSSNESLRDLVRAMALAAAFEDPRFSPLGKEELSGIHIEISALSPLEDCKPEDIAPGTHGAQLSVGWRSGVFLPQVASEQGWDREEFLTQLCYKAGLPAGSQRDPNARLQRFTAFVFSEEPREP